MIRWDSVSNLMIASNIYIYIYIMRSLVLSIDHHTTHLRGAMFIRSAAGQENKRDEEMEHAVMI